MHPAGSPEPDENADAGPPTDAWRLVFDQTIRLMDRQAAVLGELRTRASVVLTATGIVASLLGAQVLNRQHPWPSALLPLVALAFGLLSCVAVIRPVRDGGFITDPQLTGLSRLRALVWAREQDPRAWQVTVGTDRLEALRQEAGGNPDLLREKIVRELRPACDVNYRTNAFRSHFLVAACLCLPVQIVLWTVVLGRLSPVSTR